jgi:hypothetical protein
VATDALSAAGQHSVQALNCRDASSASCHKFRDVRQPRHVLVVVLVDLANSDFVLLDESWTFASS